MRAWFVVILFFCASYVNAQKQLSLEECEALFLKNNFSLLANHYQVDASKALTKQARLWDNPIVNAELNAINPQANRYFDIGPQGQKGFSIEQLIYLGGKKKNEVRWNKSNEQISEYQFEDLLRSLRQQLRENFIQLYFNRINLSSINSQILQIDSLVFSYSNQVEKGNLPLKDLVRLKALSLGIKNEKISYQTSISECYSNLKGLLSDTTTFIPTLNDAQIEKYFKVVLLNPNDILDKAKLNRPDYNAQIVSTDQSEQFLKWQKSLAVPDIVVGGAYDQRGGAFNNQLNLTLSMPLPLINRNQGNIRYASALSDQSKFVLKDAELNLMNEVVKTYENYRNRVGIYSQFEFNENQYKNVFTGMVENFRKGNVSLLEFVDFMESYNLMSIQNNEMKLNVITAAVALESVINQPIF